MSWSTAEKGASIFVRYVAATGAPAQVWRDARVAGDLAGGRTVTRGVSQQQGVHVRGITMEPEEASVYGMPGVFVSADLRDERGEPVLVAPAVRRLVLDHR